MGHNKLKSSEQASKMNVHRKCHRSLKEGATEARQASQGRRDFSRTSKAEEGFDESRRHPSGRKAFRKMLVSHEFIPRKLVFQGPKCT